MADDAARLVSGEAFGDFCRRLERLGAQLAGDGFPDAPRERAEGYRALARQLVYALQMELESGDALHPVLLRYEDPRTQWGGPNPDNVYLRAHVAPGHAYRVWGDLTGVRQALFSLHEGDMQLGQYGVYSERALDQLAVGPDGRLELVISAEAPAAGAANWLPLHPAARLFQVRAYLSDWECDAAPLLHIERIGAGEPPLTDAGAVARGLDRAAQWVERSLPYWSRYTRSAAAKATPNVTVPPRSAAGGADNILYGSCFWDLAEGQALLVTCAAPDADYWGFTIHTLPWLESGDFANRQTSLSGHQMFIDGDGRFRVVLAHRDPGAPNWIDTEERRRGMLAYRWVRARSNPTPEARVVPLAELRTALPPAHPVVSPEERRAQLRRRRELHWRRYR
jgi:hypothetical protein